MNRISELLPERLLEFRIINLNALFIRLDHLHVYNKAGLRNVHEVVAVVERVRLAYVPFFNDMQHVVQQVEISPYGVEIALHLVCQVDVVDRG